jgi:hypothetical protein
MPAKKFLNNADKEKKGTINILGVFNFGFQLLLSIFETKTRTHKICSFHSIVSNFNFILALKLFALLD